MVLKRKLELLGTLVRLHFFLQKTWVVMVMVELFLPMMMHWLITLRGIVNHGMYERYHHDVVGVNSRLDSIQAGVLKVKLPLLDVYCMARKEAAKYNELLSVNAAIVVPEFDFNGDCHVFHQYVIRITNGKRDGLLQHLLEKGIPCAIYYPIPLHSQKAYADVRYKEEDFPITNQLLCKEVIALPMHTELDDEQIKYIPDSVLEYV
jgi:UDP-2-acetamido-2-deoxy-ribo-hexuluronate aminotransferase